MYGWAGGSAKTAAMVDTQTGRMWEVLCMVNDVDEAAKITEQRCEYTALTPIYFKHEDGSLSLTPDGKRFRLKSGTFDDVPSTPPKK